MTGKVIGFEKFFCRLVKLELPRIRYTLVVMYSAVKIISKFVPVFFSEYELIFPYCDLKLTVVEKVICLLLALLLLSLIFQGDEGVLDLLQLIIVAKSHIRKDCEDKSAERLAGQRLHKLICQLIHLQFHIDPVA